MTVRLYSACFIAAVAVFSTGCATTDEAAPVADAPATSAEAPAPEDTPSGYLLGEGDKISIQVFDEPDLTMDIRIGARGSINYSYLGDLKVTGKTASQIEREIANLLREGYLVNPSVNVLVSEYRPFFINGEVRSPGSYPYRPGLTLDKAIALAGGLTERASTRKMFVIKEANSGQGQVKVGMNARIAPGDIVSIKEGFF
ncbi:MAG: polysaccharide biosynthesis/export family protein [Granulosicoccus sp.]